MTLLIDYSCNAFPPRYGLRSGTLQSSWDELLWAAITLGRPCLYHVFRYGVPSFHEAIFRSSLIRMAVEQDWTDHLRRTSAFTVLDPTEKGMVSYFLGMTLCKVFASRLLQTQWLLHLDVFRTRLNPIILGRSRPDLVGEDARGDWHAFECKGRVTIPSSADKDKAKRQAQRIVSVSGQRCSLHVGSLAFFRSDVLELYWRDPEPDSEEIIGLPMPEAEWRYYYEPALSLASDIDSGAMAAELSSADVRVKIYPEVRRLLQDGRWPEARRLATERAAELSSEGYQPDGIKVTAGESWMAPYEEPPERG